MTTVNTDNSTQNTSLYTSTTREIKDNTKFDKDMFLQLLVAQLKYQDPASPTDSSQFMAQTAQFTQLEALQDLQKSQASMLTSQQASTATSMLGQKITAIDPDGGADIVGTVTGVKLGTDGPVLKVGDKEVSLSAVKEVNR